MADAALIKDLASRMCQAPMPSQALLEAAKACSNCLPDVVFVGLAIMARDKQSVRYVALLARQQAAPLGSAPSTSTAAGLAVHTKQAVNVRDIDTGDLGMEDLQHLRHMHTARSYYAAPLVVSQSAIGALAVASAAPHAFAGQEQLMHTVAAMCAPYITLMTSQLAALEGLLKQLLPVRVAQQLQDQQLGDTPLQQPGQAALPATAAGANMILNAGAGSSAAAAAGAAGKDGFDSGAIQSPVVARGAGAARTTMLGQLQNQHQQPQRGEVGELSGSIHSSPWTHASRWQQQHPLRSQQQQRQVHAVQTGGRASITEHQQQQQDAQQAPGSNAMGLFLTFAQPQLELAYRTSVCLQWQQLLDVLFVLLSVISAIGGRLQNGAITGDMLVDTSCLLVLVVVGWGAMQQLRALPPAKYIRVRVPIITAIRLLRLVVFLVKARYLPAVVFARPRIALPPAAAAAAAAAADIQAAGAPLFALSRVEVASCGMLLMLGLAGQLPFVWHAVVQLLSFAGVSATLHILALEKLGSQAFLPLLVLGLQVVIGWGLPVAVVALVEWHTRMGFLRKIR